MSRDVSYPPCWMFCPQIGGTIYRFVPFKTPYIDQRSELSPECIFEPTSVIEWCANEGLKLGLVIDLTKTSRYYKSADFSRHGVKHEKLPCEGHLVTPKDQVGEFKRICSDFFSKNSDAYIGVHCTHGYNRTGYLLASYLVDVEEWDIDDFLKLFKSKRPPGIYKEDYLQELIDKYQGESEVNGQVRPDWDIEVEDLDEGYAEGAGPGSLKRSIAYVQEPSQQPMRPPPGTTHTSPHMIGIDGNVGELVGGNELWKLRKLVSTALGWRDESRFPGSQPVSLDSTNVDVIGEHVSWKADGTRYMMLINGAAVFMIDRHNNFYRVPLRFPSRKRAGYLVEGTIVDGELVIDNDNGQKRPRFLIYDIALFEKERLGDLEFHKRTKAIEVELIRPRNEEKYKQKHMLEQYKVEQYNLEPFGIRKKDFFPASTAGKLLSDKFLAKLGHETDGLIFMPDELPYSPGRCNQLLKWKPPHLNTIDFQVVKTGYETCDLMLFQSGVLHKYASWDVRDYPEQRMLEMNGTIVECSLVDGRWKYLRTRDDKSHPNAVHTGEGVMRSINSGITQDKLLEILQSR